MGEQNLRIGLGKKAANTDLRSETIKDNKKKA